RALRIVAVACGLPPEEARRLLGRARGEVRTAIVMGRTGGRYAEARQRLERTGGDLRRALGRGGRAEKPRRR
ncbi:MAG TPA: hypothetical protein VGQ75_02770, partial [Thermoanaerobaculia bacterium]|nr:hypothetical protein [Thermoanaerobaculia bacterium]